MSSLEISICSPSLYFRFTVEEWPPANYAAISANIAVSGIRGGHEKYVMFLKYGSPPTFAKGRLTMIHLG